ncbi:MAG: hypothetical protein ABI723_05090 [Bacteroidia bacterium]
MKHYYFAIFFSILIFNGCQETFEGNVAYFTPEGNMGLYKLNDPLNDIRKQNLYYLHDFVNNKTQMFYMFNNYFFKLNADSTNDFKIYDGNFRDYIIDSVEFKSFLKAFNLSEVVSPTLGFKNYLIFSFKNIKENPKPVNVDKDTLQSFQGEFIIQTKAGNKVIYNKIFETRDMDELKILNNHFNNFRIYNFQNKFILTGNFITEIQKTDYTFENAFEINVYW